MNTDNPATVLTFCYFLTHIAKVTISNELTKIQMNLGRYQLTEIAPMLSSPHGNNHKLRWLTKIFHPLIIPTYTYGQRHLRHNIKLFKHAVFFCS